MSVVGILAYPLGEDFGFGALPRRTVRRAYRRALLAKANPRPPEYMRRLFTEHYPEGRIEREPPFEADEIVLLYPDAIGLGYHGIERSLPKGVPVRVLNGRRREFAFDRRARAALGLRRLLMLTMAGEAIFVFVIVAATPFLALADLVRGKR